MENLLKKKRRISGRKGVTVVASAKLLSRTAEALLKPLLFVYVI